MLCHGRINDSNAASDDVFFGFHNHYMFRRNGGQQIHFGSNAPGFLDGGTLFSTTNGVYNSFACTFDGTSGATGYIDGVAQSSIGMSRTFSAADPGFCYFGTDGRSTNSELTYGMLFNRNLTVAEIAWIVAEPFCMLRPRVRRTYMFPPPTQFLSSVTGIASGAVVGSASFALGPATLSPSGVAASDAFGSPTFTLGPISVPVTGIAPTGGAGSPGVFTGGSFINGVGVPSATALGSPALHPGPVALAPTGIAPTGGAGGLIMPWLAAAPSLVGVRFLAAEITAFRPGDSSFTVVDGWGTTPWGTFAPTPDVPQDSATILASDLGYRTAPTDAGGPLPYPPLLQTAFQIDNRMNLDPSQSGIAAAWGTLVLSNPLGQFSAIAATWNSDGRTVRILTGIKRYDANRGYDTDPAYSTLNVLFSGVATPWFLSDTSLSIPLRDATYWLERPLQANVYLGTGTYEGGTDLAGKPKPKTRGGTSLHPVRNVTPVLVDSVNLIYQYSDAAGTVVNLYEGGALTILFDSDTANLYVGSTPAGYYRTDNSRGLFQLGSPPAPSYAITADVTGEFLVAGAQTTVATLARYMLAEEISLPSAYLATAAFTALNSAYPYAAGVYFDSSSVLTGVDAMNQIVAAAGFKLIQSRNGTVRLLALRAIPVGTLAVAKFDLTNIVALVPRQLTAAVDPPPFRFRVGYAHNYTVQTSSLNTATATAAQLSFVAVADSFQSWSSGAILTAYRRPNDPAPVTGALLNGTDAQAAANDLGALWGTRRRVYDITLPIGITLARDIGDVVNVAYPLDNLSSGQQGQIVGYQFDSANATVTFQILV